MQARVIRAHRRGAALVEASLFLVVLFILLAGVINLGRMFSIRVALQNCAREGVRYAATHPTDFAGVAQRVNNELISGGLVASTATVGTANGATVPITVTSQSGDTSQISVIAQSTSTVAEVTVYQTSETVSTSRKEMAVGVSYGYSPILGSLIGITGKTMYVEARMMAILGLATQLQFTTQPVSTTQNTAFSPAIQVAVKDALGNTVTTGAESTATITLAIGTNPGGGTLTGASSTAVAGVATYSASSINNLGTGYTLAASALGLTATSSSFNITSSSGAPSVGPPTMLAFTVPPSSPVAKNTNVAPAVQVAVQDASGNTVTSATDAITITIATGPSGGSISGGGPVSAVSGVATFSTLQFSKAGTYVLQASSSGLTVATTSGITVTN